MLTAQNITVRHGKKIALQNVGIVVHQGEILALVGPNGSGKTTLLRVLSGNLIPNDGQITWENRPLGQIPARERAQILAFVPQETAMPFSYSVEECVALGEASREAREEAIALMELESFRHTPLPHLSGGERQRASIARGLAQKTPYLLLDEPTAHLDLRYQDRLFTFLKEHTRKPTVSKNNLGVVLVLHDLASARRVADRFIVLDKGEVHSMGGAKDVLTSEMLESVYGIPATFIL